MKRRAAADLQPIFQTQFDEKLSALREHFGATWTWREIAAWSQARGNAGLPAWQVAWAQEFMENYQRAGSEAA